MIETIDYKLIPATVLHRITGDINVDEVKFSMTKAYDVVDNAIKTYGRCNLLIDARGLQFTDDAHTLWKQKIENEPQFRARMNYMVFVLDYSPKARAAKKRRETANVRFFYSFDEATNWLSKASSGRADD